MNALGDPRTIAALYRASQAGVDVDLIIRGFCILRPGVPNLSERITVISVLGRFLEHGRIFVFENGGDVEYYIGSADWRPRNLKSRVEVVTPVRDSDAKTRLEYIVSTEFDDPTAWVMSSDGTYEQGRGATAVDVVTAQEEFMRGGGDPPSELATA
jgi:polyphosphate kinase